MAPLVIFCRYASWAEQMDYEESCAQFAQVLQMLCADNATTCEKESWTGKLIAAFEQGEMPHTEFVMCKVMVNKNQHLSTRNIRELASAFAISNYIST